MNINILGKKISIFWEKEYQYFGQPNSTNTYYKPNCFSKGDVDNVLETKITN